MDINNAHLKSLMERTDLAFKALMHDPQSAQLNQEYEAAKQELDHYLSDMRQDLRNRCKDV